MQPWENMAAKTVINCWNVINVWLLAKCSFQLQQLPFPHLSTMFFFLVVEVKPELPFKRDANVICKQQIIQLPRLVTWSAEVVTRENSMIHNPIRHLVSSTMLMGGEYKTRQYTFHINWWYIYFLFSHIVAKV